MDPTPVAATVDILRAESTITLEFDEAHLVVSPVGVSLSEETAGSLYELAKEAQEKAYARACSSLLVGGEQRERRHGRRGVLAGRGRLWQRRQGAARAGDYGGRGACANGVMIH